MCSPLWNSKGALPLFSIVSDVESASSSVTRNVARNDLVTQIRSLPDDSPQDFLDKELIVIQKFLKTHETEVRVGIYDLEVFMAIDGARARLQKADKDLETLRNELSYKEQQTQTGK